MFVSDAAAWGDALPAAPKHPHLLITDPQWEALSNRARREPQWFHSTFELANHMTRRPVGPGARVSRSVAHDFADEVTTLAFVYRLTGEKIFLEAAAKRLRSAGALATWKGDEFLDTAWILYGCALAYDWLFDALPLAQIDTLRRSIQRAGLAASAEAYRSKPPTWWVRAPLNWNLVCNGATALAAMAVTGEVPEAAPLLAAALSNLEPALAEMNPHGGWAEGSEYLVYSLQFLVPTLLAYETTFGRTPGLFERFPGILATGRFFAHTRGPTDVPFNFADCRAQTWAKSAPELFYVAKQSGDPLPRLWCEQHPDNSWRHIFYQSTGAGVFSNTEVSRDGLFRGVEVVTLREAWDMPQSWYVAMKGGAGPARVRHGHFDLGSFVLDALGERWANDPGPDYYTLPGWWHLDNKYYRKRAEGHNTVLINPGSGPGQNPGAFCPVTGFATEKGEARATVDITAAYAPAVSRLHRGLRLFDHRTSVLIQDEVEAPTPVAYTWLFHTEAAVTLDPDRRGASLEKNGKKIRLWLLAPARGTFSAGPAGPLPQSPRPLGQHLPKNTTRVSISLAEVTRETVAVVFAPTHRAIPPPPTLLPLSMWARPDPASKDNGNSLPSLSHPQAIGEPKP